MLNKVAFVFSLAVIVVLHAYVLMRVIIPQKVMTVNPQKRVSPVINLQQVILKKEEPTTEPVREVSVAELPKPIARKVITKSRRMIKKRKRVKKKAIKKKFQKVVQKEIVKQKKLTTSKQVEQKSAPALKAIHSSYLIQIRKIIERNKKYPRRAKRMHHEGTVKVQFTITKNGHIRDIRVVGKSSYSTLNHAALILFKKIGLFPPIPREIGKAHLTITVPIHYKILH